MYVESGAVIVDQATLFTASKVIVKVRVLSEQELFYLQD